MLDSDILTFLSAEVSAASTNGGRRSYNQVISGVINNVWPHVTKAERTAGSILHRFLYTLAGDDDDGTLISADEFIDSPTDGEDYVIAFEIDYGSTQADITGSEKKYGSSLLDSDVAAASGPVTFDVTVEHTDLATGTNAIFEIGDSIRITDKINPDSVSGNEEFLTLTNVSNVDELVTLTVSEDLANSYTVASNTRVMSIISYGDIKTSSDNYVITTDDDGDYDYTTYPIILDNLGTEEDSLTFTWTDATHFTCTGSSGNDYGSGNTGEDFIPTNPNNSKPYFTLEFLGFSGTWAGSDTLTIDIHEASFLTCLKRVVPAACASLANNKVTSVTTGESEV